MVVKLGFIPDRVIPKT